jgi:hypothetical protein
VNVPSSKLAVRVGIVAAVVVTARAVATSDDGPTRWLVVARDSSYTISIDTAHIVALPGRVYEIWYRTDHSTTRYYKENAFTRETVRAILRCDGYSFRVASVAMSMGAGRPVARQITEPRDLARQAWRRVEAGSTEADAARATCVVADWAKWGRR